MNIYGTYCRLVEDVFALYCKTKNSKVEDAFLKLAQFSRKELTNWLVSANFSNIKDLLSEPLLIDAFKTMLGVRSKIAYGEASSSNIVKMFLNSGTPPALEVIITLAGYLEDPVVGYLLDPFRDIINAVATWEVSTPAISSENIGSDLIIISDAFVKHMEHDKAKSTEVGGVPINISDPSGRRRKSRLSMIKGLKTQMFYMLYQKFNDEISRAAEEAGYTKLAQTLRSQGILGRLSLLSEYIIVGEPDQLMMERAQKIVSQVISNYNPSSLNQNYEYIKQKSLSFAGAVPEAQLEEVRNRKKEAPIPLPGQDIEPEEVPELKIETRMWLKPDVITMISIVFALMYRAINK